MPTGYTADIADGKITLLRDFALRAARAMGALISMRDEPYDAPIPDYFEPSSYHKEQGEAAQQRLDELMKLREPFAIASACDAWNQEVRERNLTIIQSNLEKKDRYRAMIEKVTKECERVRKRNEWLAQLRSSLEGIKE